MDAIDEPTTPMRARVPASLARAAVEKARENYPHVSASGVIRLALARLAGLPDDYSADLPRTNVRYRSKAT